MKQKGIMKKWLLTLCVALLSVGAQAQERGDFGQRGLQILIGKYA